MTTTVKTSIKASVAAAKSSSNYAASFGSAFDGLLKDSKSTDNALLNVLLCMFNSPGDFDLSFCRNFFNRDKKSQTEAMRNTLTQSVSYKAAVDSLARAKASAKGEKDSAEVAKLQTEVTRAEKYFRDCLSAVYAMRASQGLAKNALDAKDVNLLASKGLVQMRIGTSLEYHKYSASGLVNKGRAFVAEKHPKAKEERKTTATNATNVLLISVISNIRAATAAKQPVRNFAGDLGPLYSALGAALLENMRLDRQPGDTEVKVRALDAVPYKDLIKEFNDDMSTVNMSALLKGAKSA